MYYEEDYMDDEYESIDIYYALEHSGTPQMYDGDPNGSGRYRQGSGKTPYQRATDFSDTYKRLRNEGISDKDIASSYRMTITQLKQYNSIALETQKYETLKRIEAMKQHGDSNVKIAKALGLKNESTVRSYLERSEKIKRKLNAATAETLMKNVDEKGFIDVGSGVEVELGVSRTRLDAAIAYATMNGYETHNVKYRQLTNPGNKTTVKVLCPPGTSWIDVQNNMEKIKSIDEYSPDKGKTFYKLEYPSSISSDRVYVKYAEDGGTKYDGLIELRPNVKDLSLGNSHYAQVRIGVDDKMYLKGMAIYSDSIPKGYDVVFNTNKKKGTPLDDVLKPYKEGEERLNEDNPFGATIKANGQYHYVDDDGKVKLGAVNKLKEEGDWGVQSNTLASQFLSKQSIDLVKSQLDISTTEKQAEFEEIKDIKNSAIKKYLLGDFASSCDKDAEDLKAAAFPGQTSKVLIPVPSLKDNEIYAPTYKNGTVVCLVRYPHGGTFEIPRLVVNNSNKEGRAKIGPSSVDAVGINTATASTLSGADFDGDSVIVIPESRKVKITTSKSKTLKDFDPSIYELPPDKDENGEYVYPGIDKKTSYREMGKITNLISDMSLFGADIDEIERATKHSMVVIDAPKHRYDIDKSYKDFNIAELKKKYQGGANAGAATIISRASSEDRRPETKIVLPRNIDPKTGEIHYEYTGRTYIDKRTGKEVAATDLTTKMQTTNDARTLLSKNPNVKEIAYANYANEMKRLGNEGRKEWLKVKVDPISQSAKSLYAKEIASLDAKLETARTNAPKERQAQLIAKEQWKAVKADNPNITKEEASRAKDQLLQKARASVGASKKDVEIHVTKKEWEAINANAISHSKVTTILNNMNSKELKELAVPKQKKIISDTQKARMKAMSNTYTIAQIAEALGVSPSTVSKAIGGKED